jgi:hypothetical protein
MQPNQLSGRIQEMFKRLDQELSQLISDRTIELKATIRSEFEQLQKKYHPNPSAQIPHKD